ncbi:MAG TPA: glycosyltransferase family 2 protein [Pararhizobium sp.]|nr:glycosyltransferase family 2 protein [Pararhizobium sp.]
MPSIDIAIPNYNYGRYLGACIASVLSQDGIDLRVLVIDNGSADESVSVARAFARADRRVQVRLRQTNVGPHASFNEAIDWARADYFLMLCSDDLLVPGALHRAIAVMEKNCDVAFVYGRDVQMRGNGPAPQVPPPPGPVPWSRMEGLDFIRRFCRLGVFQIPGPTLVVRTAVQKRAGYYRSELPHSDDYDVWLRFATFGAVGAMDCVQAVNRRHADNRSGLFRNRQLLHIRHTAAAADCFFAHEGSRLPGAARLHRLARRSLAERAYWAAVSGFLRGQPAHELFSYAFHEQPRTALLPPVDYLLRRPDTRQRMIDYAGRLFTARRHRRAAAMRTAGGNK